MSAMQRMVCVFMNRGILQTLGIWVGLFIPLCVEATTPSLSEIRLKINQGKLEEARTLLKELEEKNPSQEELLFLKALFTTDGDSAVTFYEKFVSLYPQSALADEAECRIAQLLFAKGLYETALKRFEKIRQKYPRSLLLDQIWFGLGLCHWNLNHADSAKAVFTRFLDLFPNSVLRSSVQIALDSLSQNAASPTGILTLPTTPSLQSPPSHYAIQVGAFANQNNALLRKAFFERAGFPVLLRTKQKENTLLYLVWIGMFSSLEEAQATAEKIQRQYGVNGYLVSE